MAGTFGSLATVPLVAFAEIGFGVALGVLLDSFVVRSVLVTSLFLDVGEKIWWPHSLAREGDRSTRPGARGTARPATTAPQTKDPLS